MDKAINIKININGIELPLTINAKDEETYRHAAKQIHEKLRDLKAMYPVVPDEKYYYVMAMLNTSVEAINISNAVSTQPYQEMMKDIETEINKIIQ